MLQPLPGILLSTNPRRFISVAALMWMWDRSLARIDTSSSVLWGAVKLFSPRNARAPPRGLSKRAASLSIIDCPVKCRHVSRFPFLPGRVAHPAARSPVPSKDLPRTLAHTDHLRLLLRPTALER